MNNKNQEDKRLTIRIPRPLMEKFQKTCSGRYKTMSEAIRDFIQDYIKEVK
jgi:metal-responsive CopG/Arc/MetJ family transcriptional regulator